MNQHCIYHSSKAGTSRAKVSMTPCHPHSKRHCSLQVVTTASGEHRVCERGGYSQKHSLFLPLQRGAGPMALMLWLDWVT
jgi:hypothetical protein